MTEHRLEEKRNLWKTSEVLGHCVQDKGARQERRETGTMDGTPRDVTSPFSASLSSSLLRGMKSGCQSCPCLPHSLEGPANACFWLVKRKQQAKYWERSLLGGHESCVNPIQFPVAGAQGPRKAVSWFMFSLSLGDWVSPVVVLQERMLHSCTARSRNYQPVWR